MTVIDPFNLSHNVVGNVNANFCPRLVAEMKRAAELSAHWESKSSSDHQVEAHRGLTGLFELADLEADKKASKSGKKKQKTSKKTPEKGEKETKPFVGRMEGEQENGEFHIILSMSKATLKSKELLEAAREQGLTPEQHWLHLAKDYTIKVLEEVFLAQLVENRGESSKGETLMEVDSKEKPAEAQPKGKKRLSHNAFTVEGTSENVSSMGSEKVTRGLDLEEMPQKRLCFDAGTTILPCPLSNTSTILATTSLCSVTRVPSTSLTCDSTAVTNSTLMTSSSSSASSTINSSTHRTVTTTPAPQISLQCTCYHQVWQGRKKLRTKMIQEIDPSLSSVTSLAFERELTQRLLGCQADGDVSQRFPTETINVEQTLKDLFGQPHCQKDMRAFDGKATDASSVEHENYCLHEMRIGENGTGLIASDNCKNINATAERDKFIAPAEYSGTTCINDKGIHVSPESHILACKNGNGALAIQEDKWNSTNSSVSGVIRSVENPATVGMSSKTDVRPVDRKAKSKSGNNSSGTTEVNASVGKNVTNEEGVSATTDIDAESSGDNTFLSQSSNDDDMTTTNGSDSSVSKNSNDGAAGLGSCSIKCESGNVVSASSVSHTTTGKGESCVETVPKTTMFGNKDKKEVTVSDGKTDHKTSSSQCQAHLEKPTAESSEGTSCSSKKQSAFCVEFSCDLVMSGGGSAHNDEEAGRDPSSHPHLLIKLRPSQSCLSQFKVFYDPFRSVMQKLSMFELNVIAQKVPT
ncbi:hypothetical protein PoB_002798300 [Plakobranchus ocellatus]|uniref:Uncharacterized protein n=1 Tax=Plakobranchus ocellatus TaxID=259542 RepID=A0AAV4A2U1_9GAST|nr:hypothetical protein PoB_002798300 [Plakobranchus ocellatus]